MTAISRFSTRARPWIVGSALAAIAAAVVAALALAGTGHPAVVANNVSRNFRACLLTDGADTADAQTIQAAWAGLQRASATGRVNAERLPLGTSDPTAALPYFNGAVQQHCGVIISVGTAIKPAVEKAAAANSGQRFILVGALSPRANITGIPPSDPAGVTEAVFADVTSAAGT
jgi:basic membrane lipoprotein Med (substrate-binding protein (PBP1-ABC) superfamily)